MNSLDPLDESRFLGAVETHAAEEIRELLAAGLDPRVPIRGRAPVEWLLEMYTRSPRFPECLRLLLDAGGELEDRGLAAVLLDDADAIREALSEDPGLLGRRVTLPSSYTSLSGALLLHVAADFGNTRAAAALLELGADVDARAALDEHGLGGQTALFHTVNSNGNHCRDVMTLLLETGARADLRLEGVRWGAGFPWETTFYDVTPVSYAQAGLMPQMHRDPEHVYGTIEILLRAAGRTVPPRRNVPNAYVESSAPE